jgi:hypothetical protein
MVDDGRLKELYLSRARHTWLEQGDMTLSFSWLKGEVRENLKDWESFQIFKCFFPRYHIMKDINKILAKAHFKCKLF